MRMIAKGVTRIVLHMADQHIMPVSDVKRSVRGELQVYRPEVFVVRLYKILAMAAPVAGAIICQRMLFCAQEAYCIIDEKITLNIVGKMTARNKLKPGGRTHAMFFLY